MGAGLDVGSGSAAAGRDGGGTATSLSGVVDVGGSWGGAAVSVTLLGGLFCSSCGLSVLERRNQAMSILQFRHNEWERTKDSVIGQFNPDSYVSAGISFLSSPPTLRRWEHD